MKIENDLGRDDIRRLVLRLAIPSMLAQFINVLYSVVDRIYIGNIPVIGETALAGVGVSGPIVTLISAFAYLVGLGGSPLMSIRMGEGQNEKAKKILANSFWMIVGLSAVLTLVLFVFKREILTRFGVSEAILPYAESYFTIYLLGTVFALLSIGMNQFIICQGFARIGMISVALGAVTNIVLDPVFIFVLDMGVAGAAWAPVISQGVSGAACLVYMVKKFEILRIRREEWKVDGHMMMVLCGMGVPMGLQYSITAIGSVILQTAANTLGSAAVAAMTAGGKIGNFLACPFDAMGSTMATYGGQNVGAGKLDRLGKGLKACVTLGVGYSVIAFLIAVFFGDPLAQLFVDGGEAEIIANVRAFLLWNTAFYIPLALVNIVRFLIQGMGFPKFAILAGVFEMIARSLAGFGLVPIIGFTGVCLGSPIAWLMADAFLIPAYFHVSKVLQKRMVPQTDVPQAV